MTKEITIKNIARDKNLGYGISTQPTGRGTEISYPSAPDYVGTIKQIVAQMDEDKRYLNSIQSAYKSSSFFYGSNRIISVSRVGKIRECSDNCASQNEERYFMCDCDCYGEGWFKPSFADFWDNMNNKAEQGSLLIKVEVEND